ncbi:unnamed protein product, partial [Mesorhabditis belari]|uniref:Uncharacterized protein n=1 Tax=Mesorhabditis belari TaxID=2138241 RepID=A0AAF3J9S6_9BILA
MDNYSSAEAMAKDFDKDGGPEVHLKGGKRTKNEIIEHQYGHPEGDSRRIVEHAINANKKRQEQQQSFE